MKPTLTCLTAGLALAMAATPALAENSYIDRVSAAAVGEHRSAGNQARNEFRNPVQTLSFFGFEDGMSVLEIYPGGGWYAEVLAPAIRDHGTYTIANWDPEVEGLPSYQYELPKRLRAKFDANPELYDQVKEVHFSPPSSASLGDADSYDRVLTFRNSHGWVGSGMAEDIYAEFARVLKPGGMLGVVQHRAAPGGDPAVTAEMGYVPEAAIIAIAEAAGLEFVASSEVNSNPMDSRDHPEGVWTLPPGLALGDQDRAKFQAIGESDRMTLTFVKPAN